jgi:hypothetical protein
MAITTNSPSKKPRDWSLIWAFVAFILTTGLSISQGKDTQEKIKSVKDQGINIILATVVTFTASKIQFLESTKRTADDLLKTARGLNDKIDEKTKDLSNTANEITSLSGRADKAILSLEKTARDLMNLNCSIPEQLLSDFDSKDKNSIILQIDQAFRQHKQVWIDSSKNLNSHIQPSVVQSWADFVQTCIKEGQPSSQTAEINTSPKAYTESVTTICKKLLEMYPDKNITLFLVTAMLPEHFYNWPQTAFSDHAYPEYISHTWKGSHEYFPSMKDLTKEKRLRIRRCILVKDNTYKGKERKKLPSLGIIDDLRSSANLHIYNDSIKYNDFKNYRIENMFGQTTKLRSIQSESSDLSYASYEDGKKIIDIDKFEFYPVGTRKQFANSMIMGNSLCERFIQELHSKQDDALYYTLRDTDVEKLKPLFNSELDIMPELAMFKLEAEKNWLFGISGLLAPFTQSICLRFLAGNHLNSLQNTLRYLEFESDFLITLFKPELIKDGFESEYRKERTDWEQLRSNYQSEFVSETLKHRFNNIKNILDIGCGRGYGILTMLLNEPGLNKPDVSVLGIDIASNAISQANNLLQRIKDRGLHPNIPGFPVKRDDVQLKCNIKFEQCDILDDSTLINNEYDLVIDWMCFHELPKADWNKYVSLLEKICTKWFVLNVFHLENEIKMHGLEAAAEYVPKHQISESTIRDLFQNFVCTATFEYPENSEVQLSGSPISAKKAYLFGKKD